MAQLAVSLLPGNARSLIGGPAVRASVANSAQLGDIPTPAQLPELGTPSVMVGTAPTAGKYEVINFWASTCTACVQELPQLQSEFVKDGRAVEFTGVDVSDPARSAVTFAAHADITYPLAAGRWPQTDPERSREISRSPGCPTR